VAGSHFSLAAQGYRRLVPLSVVIPLPPGQRAAGATAFPNLRRTSERLSTRVGFPEFELAPTYIPEIVFPAHTVTLATFAAAQLLTTTSIS